MALSGLAPRRAIRLLPLSGIELTQPTSQPSILFKVTLNHQEATKCKLNGNYVEAGDHLINDGTVKVSLIGQ